MVTPRITHTFLTDALRDIRFNTVMDRFGMFFLHDLKIKEGKLKELVMEDTPEALHVYGKALRRKAPLTVRSNQVNPINQRELFPWGPNPSWTRIQRLLTEEPVAFLQTWVLEVDWEKPTHLQCELLFVQFTCDLWLSLAEGFSSLALLPKPRTLEEAMQTWTVEGIFEVLGQERCRFLASAHGLEGTVPSNLRKQISFRERRTIFFPALAVKFPQNSIWNPYMQDKGYISKYHSYLKDWEEEEVQELQDDLDNIFSQLQCLPASVALGKPGDVIWTAALGRISFVANSKYYRIREIGRGLTKTNDGGPKRPQASVLELEKRLGQVPKKDRRTRTHLKSEKFKKTRVPPTRQKGGVESKEDRETRGKGKQAIPLAALKSLRSNAHSKREGCIFPTGTSGSGEASSYDSDEHVEHDGSAGSSTW